MDNYFDKVLDLQERLAKNEITFEEFEKQMNMLEPSSVQIDNGDDLLSNNMSELSSIIRNQNEIFKGYLGSLNSEVKENESVSSRLKKLSEQIKITVEPAMNEISSRVNKDKIDEVTSRLTDLGKKVVSIAPDKIKSFKDVINFSKNSCNHEFVYLLSEVSPYRYESEMFRSMSSTKLIICKCLDCGKEFTSSRDKLVSRLIESEKTYSEVRDIYKKSKRAELTSEELLEEINKQLNDDIKLSL